MKTRSVSASTANAVMPTVAVFWPPSLATATHSCVLANNKFSGFTVSLLIQSFINHEGHKGHKEDYLTGDNRGNRDSQRIVRFASCCLCYLLYKRGSFYL